MEITKVRELIAEKSDRGKELELKPVVKCLLSFVGSMLMMNPFVLMQLSPFSISLITALSDACSLWASAGGILGAFLFFDGTRAVRYIAIILLCLLIKGACAKLLDDPELRVLFSYINAFASTLVTGTAIMLATGFDAEEFIGTIFEAILAGGGAYVFRLCAGAIWSSRDISQYTTFETASVILCGGIMLMHFFKYSIFGFSPVILIFCFCTLVSARVKGSNGGALCGSGLGLAAGLCGKLGFVCVGLALGGLWGGEFVRKSRHACAIAFFVPVCICAVADGKIDSFMMIAEALVAAAVFLIVPEKPFDLLCKKVNTPVPVYVKSDSTTAIAKRLNDISYAIARVSDCVNTVQHTLKPLPENELNGILRHTWSKVCEGCELKNSCIPEVKNPTNGAIERIATALSNHAYLDETRFPKGFSTSCYSFSKMQDALSDKYIEFTARQGAQGEVRQIRRLMSDQLKNTSSILNGLAKEFGEEININSEAADSCAAEAREFGLDVVRASSHLDKYGRICISLSIVPPKDNFSISKFTENLSNIIGTQLELPEIEESGTTETLKFRQKRAFDVHVGAFSKSTDGEAVCGDYYRSFCDGNGRYIIILSDGMGTGSRAAVDSAMAAELFSRLVKSDLSFDCALSIANSALLVKSGDESLATLDVVCIDLYTGNANFFKAGAASSFIHRKGKTAVLEQASMPIGILHDATFSKAVSEIQSGDTILMVSDGVLGDNNGWIQQELKLWNTEAPPQKLAEFIVSSAYERKLAKHRDDMTAIAIYIE